MNAIAEPLDIDMPLRTDMAVCIHEAIGLGDMACVQGDADPVGIRIAQARLIEALAALHAEDDRTLQQARHSPVPCGVA